MDYSRQRDHYAVKLADDLLNCCESGMADFLRPAQFPYYTQNMLTNQALSDVGQLKTLLDNASRGTQYINYAPTYMLQDSKIEWFKNNKNDQREIGSIIYKGKDENGNRHYEMMSPARRFNPGINESPMTQIPVPNVGIYRQNPVLDLNDPKGIEKYVTGVIGNYFNAAFTKTPYFPPQWGGQETEMLSRALNADPSLAIRMSQQAYTQATSVKMENTVNRELNENVIEAMKSGLPPFNTKKQDAVIGPVNAGANNIPVNGVDFINSYYNSLNGKTNNNNTAVTQNGFIPYQTHNVKPRSVDKFLVEEYGNIMNASLTGTPYSGSVTPAQLRNLSESIEKKMAKNPAYMSGIVNQAHQNVLGYNYFPYDKEAFIAKARDPSSSEYKMLNDTIEKHLNDIIKNKKMSFNGEFQELSKDLTEKRRNATAADQANKPSARTTKTTPAKKDAPAAAGPIAPDEMKMPSAGTSSGRSTAGGTHTRGTASPDTEGTGERPSFTKEVGEFVNKNIIEKKPALVLADTFLGTIVDKAKKIVRTGKTIAAAFVIAGNVLAPNLQMPTAASLARTSPPAVTISVNREIRSAARETVKTVENARQAVQNVKSAAQHANSAARHIKSAARR